MLELSYDFYNLVKAVYYMGGVGGEKLLSRVIAIGDGNGGAVGAVAHFDVESGVAYHKRLGGIDLKTLHEN